MVYATAAWVALAAALAGIAVQRAGHATEVDYHDIPEGPQPSDLVGPYALNTRLRDAVAPVAAGKLDSAETVAIGGDGALLFATRSGDVLRLPIDRPEDEPELWARLGGVPLGMAFDPRGTLWVADAARGLLAVDPATRQATLAATHATDANGTVTPIAFADDVAVASDGRVFLSDASAIPPTIHVGGRWDGESAGLLDFMTGRPTGRLLVYEPETRQTAVLLAGLWFANGVALAADESFVAVAETIRFRIMRYWLRGPLQGTSDVLIDRLPGCPDGVSNAASGGFWVAIPSLKPAGADLLARSRHLRALVARLGKAAQLELPPWGLILRISEAGEVLDCLHDPAGQRVRTVSAVTEHNGTLYLGTLKNDFIPVLASPAAP
eukprot:TRINITY_DN5949_c0_g1_i1.p2 TRINITY_DN5949_c0_g1~~TRINITY_DN5949_c0_g1_i1.p2  ORF type:complete len:389 (+),score=131.16 TRINITY_DN5949_c0_g1_i1:25-1167(+)